MTILMQMILVVSAFLPSEDPVADVPELKALDHYAGTWDVEMTIVPRDPNQQGKTFRGQVEAKWVVGGRFLEQTGTYRLSETGQPLVIKTLMTYDTAEKQYHYWLFLSSGGVRESRGQWNEQTKTMTSTMKSADGDVTTTTADFSTAGEENWTIETRHVDNSIAFRITGKNTRRK